MALEAVKKVKVLQVNLVGSTSIILKINSVKLILRTYNRPDQRSITGDATDQVE